MKLWWARLQNVRDGYGDWVPTGLADRAEAKHYIKTYYKRTVWEWLQL